MARTFNEYEEMITQRRAMLVARHGGEEQASYYIANDQQLNDYYNVLDALARNEEVGPTLRKTPSVAMHVALRWYDHNGVIHVGA